MDMVKTVRMSTCTEECEGRDVFWRAPSKNGTQIAMFSDGSGFATPWGDDYEKCMSSSGRRAGLADYRRVVQLQTWVVADVISFVSILSLEVAL